MKKILLLTIVFFIFGNIFAQRDNISKLSEAFVFAENGYKKKR